MLPGRQLSGMVSLVSPLWKLRFCFTIFCGDHWPYCIILCIFSEIKERIKKTKDEKKAKKAEVTAKTQKAQGKGNMSKGAAPKGPKLGGGGGKRWKAPCLLLFYSVKKVY